MMMMDLIIKLFKVQRCLIAKDDKVFGIKLTQPLIKLRSERTKVVLHVLLRDWTFLIDVQLDVGKLELSEFGLERRTEHAFHVLVKVVEI